MLRGNDVREGPHAPASVEGGKVISIKIISKSKEFPSDAREMLEDILSDGFRGGSFVVAYDTTRRRGHRQRQPLAVRGPTMGPHGDGIVLWTQDDVENSCNHWVLRAPSYLKPEQFWCRFRQGGLKKGLSVPDIPGMNCPSCPEQEQRPVSAPFVERRTDSSQEEKPEVPTVVLASEQAGFVVVSAPLVLPPDVSEATVQKKFLGYRTSDEDFRALAELLVHQHGSSVVSKSECIKHICDIRDIEAQGAGTVLKALKTRRLLSEGEDGMCTLHMSQESALPPVSLKVAPVVEVLPDTPPPALSLPFVEKIGRLKELGERSKAISAELLELAAKDEALSIEAIRIAEERQAIVSRRESLEKDLAAIPNPDKLAQALKTIEEVLALV